MKRAYNYFFGGAQPVPAPPSPTTPLTTTDITAPSKDQETPRENGIDTPPETPRHAPLSEDEAAFESPSPPSPKADDSLEVQIQKLKKQLAHAEADLDEAQKVAQSQDEHVKSLEEDYKEREKGFEEREVTLQQDKKDLEEHMRNTVRDECETEFKEKLASVTQENEARITALQQEIESLKAEIEKLKSTIAGLEADKEHGRRIPIKG
ncbi:hypothetical protein BKA66DRAFT_186445 [Pyrenochaeta sp. MPI-SDFR-AT-0127]|nr:hypothetical protein BKA66DRAFT_186445 [Pyrenochaeta sp. MPI-SDFR-AT-0127]